MRIAVSGASGLIGKETVNHLNTLGYQVLALGRDGKKLRKIFNDSISIIETNYQEEQLFDILAGVDAVFHLAAIRPDKKNNQLVDFWQNIEITESLLNASIKNGIKKFCYASSRSVYSQKNFLPYQEQQIPLPISKYGISKLVGEHLCNYYYQEYGISTINLRFSIVYGIGDLSGKQYVFNTFLSKAIHKETLKIFGSGQETWDFIYVNDVAFALQKTLEVKDLAGTFNIGSGQVYSILEIAQCINEVFDNSGNLEVDTSKQIVSGSFSMDNSLANAHLGWSAVWSLKPALEDMREKLMKANH